MCRRRVLLPIPWVLEVGVMRLRPGGNLQQCSLFFVFILGISWHIPGIWSLKKKKKFLCEDAARQRSYRDWEQRTTHNAFVLGYWPSPTPSHLFCEISRWRLEEMWTDLTTLLSWVFFFFFFSFSLCGKFVPADVNSRNFVLLNVLPQAADVQQAGFNCGYWGQLHGEAFLFFPPPYWVWLFYNKQDHLHKA